MLEIKDLNVSFPVRAGMVHAVRNVDLKIPEGKVFGIVGESGCGKSTLLYSILGLNKGARVDGEIQFQGDNLVTYDREKWQKLRGNDISMIFQDPMSTLNPMYKIGAQIRESLRAHGLSKRKGLFGRSIDEEARIIDLLSAVGIPSPESRQHNYPHEFSGGMQQRALIAIALACEPKVLLADEPTTALDVTIQTQVMRLLKRLNRTRKMTIVLVTHDLALAAETCDDVAVMYAGQIVEQGPIARVIAEPRHPYTRGLIASVPAEQQVGVRRLHTIPGSVPDLSQPQQGCAFADRCAWVTAQCRGDTPPLRKLADEHYVRCLRDDTHISAPSSASSNSTWHSEGVLERGEQNG